MTDPTGADPQFKNNNSLISGSIVFSF